MTYNVNKQGIQGKGTTCTWEFSLFLQPFCKFKITIKIKFKNV